MSSVAAGLETGPAPDAMDAFERALEEKGITGGGSSSGISVRDGLTFEGEAPAGPAKADTPANVTTTETEEADPLHDDPEINAYLARFGGDQDKALKAAVEAQRQIGRQGNELGELRSKVDVLTGRIEQVAATPVPQPAQVQWTQEQLESSFDGNDGVDVATWAANNAPHLLPAILDYWADQSGAQARRAVRFEQDYESWLAGQQQGAATTPNQTEEYVKQQIEGQRMQASLEAVATEFDGYEGFQDFLPAALEASSRFVREAVLSSDDETQREGLRLVFEKAEKLHAADLGGKAKAQVATERIAAKRTAQVIRGQGNATTLVDDGSSGAQTSEAEKVAAFKKELLENPGTSVKDGLTFGK